MAVKIEGQIDPGGSSDVLIGGPQVGLGRKRRSIGLRFERTSNNPVSPVLSTTDRSAPPAFYAPGLRSGLPGGARGSLGRLGPAVRACGVLRPGEDGRDTAAILDNNGHANRAYGIGGSTQLLRRPDGYIGLVTQDRSSTAVRAHPSEISP
jgi:hypothetical protein